MLEARERYFLLTSVVVPRPIAWISTLDSDGVRNLAPYSYFNACSATPPIVHFTSTTSRDSLANVRTTGEFVVNVVSEDLTPAMRVSSAALYSGEDEFEVAGLQTVPSRTVAPPASPARRSRWSAACASCWRSARARWSSATCSTSTSSARSGATACSNPTLLRPVGRLSAPYFATVSEVYSLDLPEDVKQRASDYTIRGGTSGPGGSV